MVAIFGCYTSASRKAKEAMDDAERKAIVMQEAEELAAVQLAQVDASVGGDVTE